MMIKLTHVTKTFDRNNVVDDVSLEIYPNETLVLLGSSGSGKTTILKMINRLIEPTSGTIEINGQNTKELNPIELCRSIGYVFQGIGLFPHLTIEENIAIVLKLNKVPASQWQTITAQSLELVNLDSHTFSHRYPCELSGGQQQRVGVARALVTQSNILLMDEPFGALDAINRDSLQHELLKLKKQLKKTLVFVTHDIFEALRLADRIAILNKGHLEQADYKKNIINNPATKFVEKLFAQASKQLKHYTDLLHE